jgi:transposase
MEALMLWENCIVAPPKKYPPELRERAVRLVFQIRKERGTTHGVIAEVSERLGIGDQSLRIWVKQAEVDSGARAGTTASDAARIVEFEREVRELRRSNDILKAASAFFARELDPRPPR